MATFDPTAAATPLAPSLPPIRPNAVTVIAPQQRVIKPCQAVAGLVREACVDEEDVWLGIVRAEANTASPWHDHGERTTYLFPLRGEVIVEFGSEGHEQVRLRADGSVYVIPPHLHHREVNPHATPAEVFLVRVGPASVTR